MEIDVAGIMVEVEEASPGLLLPTMFKDAPNRDKLLSLAAGFLSSLDPVAMETPWIVGSLNKDLQGMDRTSQSHAEGLAIDISPMYTHKLAIRPDGTVTSLAWNIVNLALFAESAWRDAAWVIEGDHIHIVDNGLGHLLLPGCALAVPTLSPWYALNQRLAHTNAKSLFNKALAVSLNPLQVQEIEPGGGEYLRNYVSPHPNQ